MNEERFIELLNLYVDHQLSREEAAELETELRSNPKRRNTYQQYCRMQKACSRLFEHERTQAPASLALVKALAAADRKIVGFPMQSVWRGRFVTISGFAAAAACVALVFMAQNKPAVDTPMAQSITVPAETKSAPIAAVQPVTIPAAEQNVAAVTESERQYYSVLPARKTNSLHVDSSNLIFAQSRQDRALDWMKQVDIKPLKLTKFEDLNADGRTNSDSNARVFLTRSPSVQEETEMTVFEFRR